MAYHRVASRGIDMGYFPDGYVYNLQISNNVINPNTQIDIAGGRCKSDDNMFDISVAMPLTVDLTVAGVNGLDAGAEAVSTWYYPWIISTSAGTPAGLISTSYTNPVLPASYVYKRRVGSFYNNAAGNIDALVSIGNSNKRLVQPTFLIYTNVPNLNPNYTTYDYTSSLPPTSKEIWMTGRQAQGGTNAAVEFGLYESVGNPLKDSIYTTAVHDSTDTKNIFFVSNGIRILSARRYNNVSAFQIILRQYTEYL